jgi:hypothetical protein
MQRDVTATDAQIAGLVSHIRECQSEISEREAEISRLKEQLSALLRERGSNWSDDQGYARLVSEGTRIGYDTTALDDLIINDPLRYGWLKDYRRESVVSERVQVR